MTGERTVGFPGDDPGIVADYEVSGAVLESIVAWSVATVSNVRPAFERSLPGRRNVEIRVEGEVCSVKARILAPLGHDLVALGAEVRQAVAANLSRMTGLTIGAVDVIVEGVYPAAVVGA